MKIGPREIGKSHPPYIVAEISGNHSGSIKKARSLIIAAKRAGADAVKTQCYDPESLTLDVRKPDFIIQSGLWKGRTLYELYSKACTPLDWHAELYRVANDLGITIFSSVFDSRGLAVLERLGCPAYKIASMEIVDTPLIRLVASTGKPIIVSTGMASLEEIRDADEAMGEGGGAFLHCTSEYPALPERAGLMAMLELRSILPSRREVGLSDHTAGSLVPIAATALGATIIEKHLKLAEEGKTEDSEFSLAEDEFKWMAEDVRLTHQALQAREGEANPTRQLRRSLYAVADIDEGEAFTEDNIRSIRPGYGLPPKKFPFLLGKKSKQRYRKGDRLA